MMWHKPSTTSPDSPRISSVSPMPKATLPSPSNPPRSWVRIVWQMPWEPSPVTVHPPSLSTSAPPPLLVSSILSDASWADEKQIKKRQWGQAIRLETDEDIDERLLKHIRGELAVEEQEIYRIDGLLDRLLPTLTSPVHIIATGGMAKDIVPQCHHQIIHDKYLLLKGLFNATRQK